MKTEIISIGNGLTEVVVSMLVKHHLTLSTAESCTGGLLGHLLTEVPGASAVYRGGVVSYSNDAKADLLAVPPHLIDTYGAVSSQVAESMAIGCRSRFASDLALAITGIAGPDGGTPEKPVGLVYLALAHPGGVITRKLHWPGDRPKIKRRSALAALNMLRLYILSLLSAHEGDGVLAEDGGRMGDGETGGSLDVKA